MCGVHLMSALILWSFDFVESLISHQVERTRKKNIKKGAQPSAISLPLHSHTLHRHRHAPRAAATTRELVALEGDDAFPDIVQVDPVVGHIGSRDDVKARFVQSFQGVLVATVADELAWLKAEEVAAAVPLLTCCPVVVSVATVDRLHVDADLFQSGKQVRDLSANGFLSVNGNVEGLVFAVHDDGLVNHASVDVEHGEHHVEMDK